MRRFQIPNPLDLIFPSRSAFSKWLRFCERRSGLILTVVTILTLAATFGTIRLYQNVDTSLTALLPEYYTSVKTLKKIDQEGARLNETIFAEGKDTKDLIAFAEELKAKMETNPEVYRVVTKHNIVPKHYAFLLLQPETLRSIRDRIQKRIGQAKLKRSGFFISFLDDEPPAQAQTHHGDSKQDLSLGDLRKEMPDVLARLGTQEEYILSRDRKTIEVRIYFQTPPSDLGYAAKIYPQLRRTVAEVQAAHPDLETYFHGPYRKRLEEYSLIQRDVSRIGWITFIAVVGALVIYFQQFVPVLLIMIPLIIGLVWTMGLTDLFIGHLNTITAFLIGILTGLGVDFCIHLYSRYLEERRKGRNTHDSLLETLVQTGRAAFTSGLNTGLVFFSLMLADFRGFSEFGFIAGIGMFACYLAIYLLLPWLIIVADKRSWITVTDPNGPSNWPTWMRMPRFLPESMTRFPMARTLLAFSIVVVGAFFIWGRTIEFEYDFGNLRSDLISYDKEYKIAERFQFGPAKSNAALLIMNSKDDIPYVNAAIQKKIKEDTDSPSLRGFSSLYSMWPPPQDQQERMAIIAEMREILSDDSLNLLKGKDRRDADELREYLNVSPYPLTEVPDWLLRQVSPKEGGIGSYGYVLARYDIRTKDGRDAMRFANDVREIRTERGTFYASSQEVVFADVLGLMLHESRLTVIGAALLIFFFVWADLRDWRQTVMVLVPLTLGMFLTLILLHSFGGKITFYNMIVLPMIIGMGEDNAVHLFHRYLEEGRGGILRAMRTTGKATWMATLTTIFGFMGLAASHHKGLQSIGLLATAGMVGCLICTLLVLPAMVQFLEDVFPDFPHRHQNEEATLPAESLRAKA